MSDWYLYAMAAPGAGTFVHFKIGISTDPFERPRGVQTGCPFPIKEILYVNLEAGEVARLAERELHASFADFRSAGEWFVFDTANLDHKRAFNDITREVLAHYLGPSWKWCRVSYERAMAVRKAEQAELTRQRQATRLEAKRRWFEALRQGRNHAY